MAEEKRRMKKKKLFFEGKMCGAKEIQSDIEKVSAIDEQNSYYSDSVGILPALGAHSHSKIKLPHYIISPFNPFYRFLSLQNSSNRFFLMIFDIFCPFSIRGEY